MPRFATVAVAILLLSALALAASSVEASPAYAAPDSVAGPPYTWTLSASPDDPYVNVGAATFGVLELYLWIIPIEQGWEAACFDFSATGMIVLGVTPSFGIQITDGCFFNPSCPSIGSVVAVVLVFDFPGEVCFAPSPTSGTNCTVDCGTPPQAWENSWIGYTNTGPTPCSYESWAPCNPVSVEPDSWGRIKADYR